jgi:hypothetical protein
VKALPGPGAAVLLALAIAAGAARAADPSGVEVHVESPAPGVTVEDHVHQARITGLAEAAVEGPRTFDVMLAVDVSSSTKGPSGVDVDGDGVVGFNPHHELLPPGSYPPEMVNTDPQDSILEAEVGAARALLARLDPGRVRVGVVTFAGEVDPTTGRRKRIDQQDAWLEIPLTDDFAAVERTLQAVVARGPRGATNFSAGLRLAIRELAGLSGSQSRPRADARSIVLFLTDGQPTLPSGLGNSSDPGDAEAAVRASELAHKAGVTVNTYALGPTALRYPEVMTEMARKTQGTYTPVQNPGDIIPLLAGVTFADVEDVVFTNLTTGDLSTDVQLGPDGSFTGYVPVREGPNRVRVSALASDGSKGTVEFDLNFRRSELADRDRMEELERIRRQNKQLELRRMELEIEAFREQQRKELELRAAPEADEPSGSSSE